MSDDSKSLVDTITTVVKDNQVYITEVTTSQSETRQKAQFENNAYFTSMKLEFPGGINLTDVNDLKRMISAVQTTNALCTSNNRKCQIRDGINPTIGNTVTAAINQGNADGFLKPEDIVAPSKLTQFIQGHLQNLVKIIQQMGINVTTGAGGHNAQPPVEIEVPPPPPAATKRKNPARSSVSAVPASQTVQQSPEEVVS